MAKALKATGRPSKRALVEEGLRKLVQLKAQEAMLEVRGKIDWDGDLNDSRAARRFP